MSTVKRYLSYIWDFPIEQSSSELNPDLEVVWSFGKKLLNTGTANYSYGNLHKVFKYAFDLEKEHIVKCKSALILGFGAGSVLEILRFNYELDIPVTGVEYDPEVIRLYEKHFRKEHHEPLEIITMDAGEYLPSSNKTFDLIVIDLFRDMEVKDLVFKDSTISELKRHLNRDGLLIFNLTSGNKTEQSKITELMLSLNKLFQAVNLYPFQEFNQIIIAK